MIPVRLAIEGFLSYRDAVEIDLSQIKVACVSGANGAGKSTLFDAITWTLFGRARRNDDMLIHNHADGCKVVFDFDYESNRYRVERIKPRGKGTTLEFHVRSEDGNWKPYTEVGIRATEERIQEVLGLDYETFVNASFFLQGKADMFSVQPPGKRKEILSNILGLTVWESYREGAASRRRDAQKQLEVQHSILKEVVAELDEEDARKAKLASLQEMLGVKAKLRENTEKLLETAQIENARIKSEKDKLDLLQAQQAEMQTDMAAGGEKMVARMGELNDYDDILAQEEEITALHQEYQHVRDELTTLNEIGAQHNTLVLQKTELEGKIQSEKVRLEQELHNLQNRKVEIDNLEKQQKEQVENAQAAEAEAAQVQAEMEKAATLEKEQAGKKDLQSEKEGENGQLRIKMDEIKERMTHLEKSGGPDCPLCGQQLTADHKKAMLAKLEAEGLELGNRYRDNQAVITNCKKEMDGIKAEINRLRALHPRLTELLAQATTNRQQLQEAARKVKHWEEQDGPRLDTVAEQVKDGAINRDLQKQADALAEKIAALDYSPQEHEALRGREVALRESEEKFRLLEKARTAREGLLREIKELEEQKNRTDHNLQKLQQAITELASQIKQKEGTTSDPAQLEAELKTVRLEENQARQDVGVAQQMVNVLDQQRKRKTKLEEENRELSRQIARLKMLETAFGKDGVPALLIENAIPQIEMQANEILDKLSAGNMSVSFETEREYADKKRQDRRQTLDIIIRDSAGPQAYELFSGGEAFRINFAIRLALSRVLAQRSGARLQTLVIDEGFGSQDEEGRQRLVEAINLVRDDFEKILVITHLDELKEAFSSRIEVTKTPKGSQVEVMA